MFKKLVVLDSVVFFPEHRHRLESLAEEIVEYPTCRDEDEVSERCRGADAIITCWVDIPHRVIDENPQLRVVGFWTHDFEHRIDAVYARARGVAVPAVPDYGTDSVAELVFAALLKVLGDIEATTGSAPQDRDDAIVAALTDDVRRVSENVKDALTGRWVHENLKTGRTRLVGPESLPAQTLKGMTVGVLGGDLATDRLLRRLTDGFQTNVVYALADRPATARAAFRPVNEVIASSQVLVYDSTRLPDATARQVLDRRPRSVIDVATLDTTRVPLESRHLTVVGLGRIGTRTAEIAVRGFGMNVAYHSRTRKLHLEDELGLEYRDLPDAMSQADIASLHLPHIGAEDVVTPELIDSIPRDGILVNCSVGSVIADQGHLLDRCEAGNLRAVLDVYRGLPPRERLRALQGRVLATYRLGWRTPATVGLKTHKLLTQLQAVAARGTAP